VRRIAAQAISVSIETGKIRRMLGPRDGRGRTLVEAGIPTYLHIQEVSASLFLSGSGTIVFLFEALSTGSVFLIWMTLEFVWLGLCACFL